MKNSAFFHCFFLRIPSPLSLTAGSHFLTRRKCNIECTQDLYQGRVSEKTERQNQLGTGRQEDNENRWQQTTVSIHLYTQMRTDTNTEEKDDNQVTMDDKYL